MTHTPWVIYCALLVPWQISHAACAITDIKQFALSVSNAHKHAKLAQLDKKLTLQPFYIIVENSIPEETMYERQWVNNFAEADMFLHQRQMGGFPVPDRRTLIGCQKGHCTFDLSKGISHNTLYLNKIIYSTTSCPHIQSIYFIDGN